MMHIVEPKCNCGKTLTEFCHKCPTTGRTSWIKGCPVCSNHCHECNGIVSPASDPNHICRIEEVINWLNRILQKYGNVEVLVGFDTGVGGSVMPYMPTSQITTMPSYRVSEIMSVNQIAVDDDDIPVALMCVANGNHPFSTTNYEK